VIVAGAREIKAVNTSLFGTSRKKVLPREAMQLINQLANNLVQDREMFGIIFSTKRSENRAIITELLIDTGKSLLDTQTIREIRHSGALPEIDMTWIVIVSLGLLTSLRFCRAKWTNLPCGSSAQWL
jgi:hypothetical protein